MNFTKKSIPINKEVPISLAEIISEEDIILWGDPSHELDLHKPEVYSLMTMAAITEDPMCGLRNMSATVMSCKQH